MKSVSILRICFLVAVATSFCVIAYANDYPKMQSTLKGRAHEYFELDPSDQESVERAYRETRGSRISLAYLLNKLLHTYDSYIEFKYVDNPIRIFEFSWDDGQPPANAAEDTMEQLISQLQDSEKPKSLLTAQAMADDLAKILRIRISITNEEVLSRCRAFMEEDAKAGWSQGPLPIERKIDMWREGIMIGSMRDDLIFSLLSTGNGTNSDLDNQIKGTATTLNAVGASLTDFVRKTHALLTFSKELKEEPGDVGP